MSGLNFGWKTFWDSNPDWSCLRLRLAAKFRHSGEAAMPGKSAGRAPSLRIIPWHSPHNRGKKHGKKNSVRVAERQLDNIQYVNMATFK